MLRTTGNALYQNIAFSRNINWNASSKLQGCWLGLGQLDLIQMLPPLTLIHWMLLKLPLLLLGRLQFFCLPRFCSTRLCLGLDCWNDVEMVVPLPLLALLFAYVARSLFLCCFRVRRAVLAEQFLILLLWCGQFHHYWLTRLTNLQERSIRRSSRWWCPLELWGKRIYAILLRSKIHFDAAA